MIAMIVRPDTSFGLQNDDFLWYIGDVREPVPGESSYYHLVLPETYSTNLGTGTRERIRVLSSPQAAKRAGRAIPRRELYQNWEDGRKEKVMRIALLRKFRQNEGLRRKLLATGDAIIQEFAPWDAYWGSGRDGNGLQRMGHLLMDVRTQLRDEYSGDA